MIKEEAFAVLEISESDFIYDKDLGTLTHWTGVRLPSACLRDLKTARDIGAALRDLEREFSAEEKQEKLALVEKVRGAHALLTAFGDWVFEQPEVRDSPMKDLDQALRLFVSNYIEGATAANMELTERVPAALRQAVLSARDIMVEWDTWCYRSRPVKDQPEEAGTRDEYLTPGQKRDLIIQRYKTDLVLRTVVDLLIHHVKANHLTIEELVPMAYLVEEKVREEKR